jgi:hypothetical protein
MLKVAGPLLLPECLVDVRQLFVKLTPSLGDLVEARPSLAPMARWRDASTPSVELLALWTSQTKHSRVNFSKGTGGPRQVATELGVV